MSLSGIFDPVVRAYFKNHCYGSGSGAMDDGYCIEWDGNTEGREVIDFSNIGLGKMYKVSNLVVGADKLSGSVLVVGGDVTQSAAVGDEKILGDADWKAVVLSSVPYVISGAEGEYSFNGVDFHIPSDGTYFLYDIADFTMYTTLLFKAAIV